MCITVTRVRCPWLLLLEMMMETKLAKSSNSGFLCGGKSFNVNKIVS